MAWDDLRERIKQATAAQELLNRVEANPFLRYNICCATHGGRKPDDWDLREMIDVAKQDGQDAEKGAEGSAEVARQGHELTRHSHTVQRLAFNHSGLDFRPR